VDGDEWQLGDLERMAPFSLLPLRPALVKAFSAPGGRAIYAVSFGVGGNALAAADANGRTYLWDIAGGGLAGTFAHPGSRGVLGVAFDPDGDLLAAADGNGRAYLWDLVSGDLARTLVPRRGGA
jgi:WD40 repeat protein